jgi:hypothetical protein
VPTVVVQGAVAFFGILIAIDLSWQSYDPLAYVVLLLGVSILILPVFAAWRWAAVTLIGAVILQDAVFFVEAHRHPNTGSDLRFIPVIVTVSLASCVLGNWILLRSGRFSKVKGSSFAP